MGSRWIWGACRGGEGEAVATVMLVGGGGDSRVRERESRGKRRGARESESGAGQRVATSGASSEEGRAGRQASRWRGAVARAHAGHTPLPLSGRKTTEEGGQVGWAACCGWAAQGGAPGKPLLFFISVFYFFLTFVLI